MNIEPSSALGFIAFELDDAASSELYEIPVVDNLSASARGGDGEDGGVGRIGGDGRTVERSLSRWASIACIWLTLYS